MAARKAEINSEGTTLWTWVWPHTSCPCGGDAVIESVQLVQEPDGYHYRLRYELSGRCERCGDRVRLQTYDSAELVTPATV